MTDNKHSFSWPVLAGDGLLLLCTLLGFTGSFLSLYGDGSRWPNATALDYCAANGDIILACAALFGLITLCVWSLPRFRLGLAGGLAVILAGAVWWNWTEVVRGAGVTVRNITTLFASLVPWGQAFPYKTGLLPAREADSVQLFLLLVLAALALLLGWAVVRSRRWWVVLLLTLPPLLPGLLADLYPDWLPFMALAACWCAMLLTSLCRRAAPDGLGALMLISLSTAALTLALITAFFPRDGYTRPDWALTAQGDLLNFTSRFADYLPHWENSPFKTTVTYVGAAEEADLAHAGPLNYFGRTVLRVTSDYGGWMYLRGSSLAVYEDGVWRALPEGTYDAYWSGQEPEVSPLYFPVTLDPSSSTLYGPVYTVTVNNIGAVGFCVYTPYFPLPQDPYETGMLPVEDAYFARKQGQWTHTVTFVERSAQLDMPLFVGGAHYPWDSSTVITYSDGGTVINHGGDGESFFSYGPTSGRATVAASGYAGYVYDNYLDVPGDLWAILNLYGRVALDAVDQDLYGYYNPVYLAERFSAYLEEICQYDAAAPAAPEGVDPVHYFLAESRRGYCMHYASAVALMLRTWGVPARYVSGFAAEISPNRETDISDRAAHAWVEVWLDGFGWYPVEVTPADAFDWMDQSGTPGSDELLTLPPRLTPEPVESSEPTETPGHTDRPDQPTATLSGGGGDVDGPGAGRPGFDFSLIFSALRIIFPVLGLFLLIWSVQFAVKRFRAWRLSGADANRSALACYGYLCRLERWGGRMDARAVELAQKARFSQHTLAREELDLLRRLLDRERSRLSLVPRLPMRLVFRYWWGRPRPPVPPAEWSPPRPEK